MSLADAYVDLHVSGERLPRETRDSLRRLGPIADKEGDGVGGRFARRLGAAMQRTLNQDMNRVGLSASKSLGNALARGLAPAAKAASQSLADVKKEALATAKAEERTAEATNAVTRAQRAHADALAKVATAQTRAETASSRLAQARMALAKAEKSMDANKIATETTRVAKATEANTRAANAHASAVRKQQNAFDTVNTAKARAEIVKLRVESEALSRTKISIGGGSAAGPIRQIGQEAMQTMGILGKLGGVAAKGAGLIGLGVAALSASQGLVALTAGLAPLAGFLAVLPVTVATATVAIAGLKIGMSGFGDALKNMGDPQKFAESLKELSPAAQQTAIAVRALKPAWDSVKKSVQERLFAGMAPVFTNMAKSVIPALRVSLGQAASGWNTFAKAGMNAFSSTFAQSGALKAVGVATRGFLTQASAALRPFLSALSTLTITLSDRVPNAGRSLTDLANRFNVFIQNADKAGKIDDWVTGAVTAFKNLASIVGSLGSILAGIGRAMSAAGGGLSPFATGLRAVADTVNGPAFQEGLTGFFTGINAGMKGITAAFPYVAQMFAALGPVLGNLAATLGPLIGTALRYVSQALAALLPALNPIIAGLGAGLSPILAALGPLLIAVAQALVPLGPAIGLLAQMFGGVLGAVLVALSPLLIVIVNIFVRLVQVLTPFAPLILVVVGALRLWAVAQLFLNGVLMANPIGFIITSIGLLIAGIVMAYQNVSWFRAGVQFAWNAIKVTVGVVVGWFQKVVWPILSSIFSWIGGRAAWLYRAAIVPAWNGIRAAVGVVVGWFQTTVWPIISSVFSWIGARAKWLYNNAIRPAWNGIRAAVSSVVNFFLTYVWPVYSKVFGFIGRAVLRLYTAYFKVAWIAIRVAVLLVVRFFTSVVWPTLRSVFGWIGGRVKWLYNSVFKPYFGYIKSYVNGVVNFYRNTIWPIFRAVFNSIGSKVKWLWDKVVSPTFSHMKRGASALGRAFETAKDAIGKAWGKVKGIVKKPIIAALKVVDSGLLGGLQKVASFVGLKDKVPRLKGAISAVQKLRDGGTVQGSSPTAVSDNIPIMGTAGEFMQPVSRVRQYGVQRMEAVRRGVADIVMPSERLAYARGGTVGFPKDSALKLASGGLVAFGRAAQRAGWRASEHPSFGGVRAGHMKGSHHYQGRAIDFNWPGEAGNNTPGEVRNAPALVAAAKRAGFLTLWQSAGHYNHVHVADAKGGGKGIFGKIGSFIGDKVGWIKDKLNPFSKIWDGAKKLLPKGSPLANMAASGVTKMGGSVVKWLKDKMGGLFDKEAGAEAFNGKAGGSVQRWAPLVKKALGLVNQPASLVQTVLRRMMQESGGNPRAINNWDSNARRGTPSKGLMQVIGPTFARYFYPGYGSNIYDPLSNILASMRYAMARYGSLARAYNKRGGYMLGGYTGAGSRNAIAGLVHKGEYVFERPLVDRLGLHSLEALRGGRASIVPDDVATPAARATWQVPTGTRLDQTSESAAPGDTIYKFGDIVLSLDDLARVNEIGAFIDMLKNQRSVKRRSDRSGLVNH